MASFSDDFNRADGPVGGNWTSVAAGFSIVSNRLSGNGFIAWSADCDTDDMFNQVTIGPSVPGTIWVHVRNPAGWPNVSAIITTSNGNWVFSTDPSSAAGNHTTRLSGSAGAGAFVAGSVVRVEAVGHVYTLKLNGTALGAWHDSGASVHSLDPTRRKLAIETNGGNLDDWSGGDIVPPSRSVNVVATETRVSSGRTVSAEFVGYAPAAGDLVLVFANTPEDSGIPSITPPSGWVSLAQEGNSGGWLTAFYHVVTSAEAASATTTFTATNYFNLAKNWRSVACVVRGGNQSDLIDGVGTTQGGTTTPHSTAAISGGSLGGGSLAVAAVAAGTTASYSSVPPGWSLVAASTEGSGIGLWVRDTTTSAGVDVASVNVTPSASVSYASISAAISAVSDASSFFALF